MAQRAVANDRKRGITLGLCYGILIAGLILFSATAAQAGCAGDCMTCHQKLAKSPEHQSLATCVKCHEPSTTKKPKLDIFAPQKDEGACGNDCFQCHNKWPQTAAHIPLDTCQTCHIPGKGKPVTEKKSKGK